MSEIKYSAVKYIRLSDADDKRDKNGNRIEKSESDSISNQRKFIDDWLKGHPDIDAVSEKIEACDIIEPNPRTQQYQGFRGIGSNFIS